MTRPTINEFDAWKSSFAGQWFFGEYLQGYADALAGANGRSAGLIEGDQEKEIVVLVRNAGIISGVESVILGATEDGAELDPFQEEREYAAESDGKTSDSEDGH